MNLRYFKVYMDRCRCIGKDPVGCEVKIFEKLMLRLNK